MKLSELPKDKLKEDLYVISARERTGRIYKIDEDGREDWEIYIQWFDSETNSYKEDDISIVRHFEAYNIRMEIPECCYECHYEKPAYQCSWLGTEIHSNNGLFCPPGICPLRKEEWPEPSEAEFEAMAIENPERLSRWIKSETLGVELSFAAEVLGKSELNSLGKEKTLLPLLHHDKAAVREGVLYGLEDLVAVGAVKRSIEQVAKEDESPSVREIAKEMLEES